MNQMTLNDVTPLLLTIMATGMDAFSVSLGIGMQKIRFQQILWIVILMGLFHMMMPFLGILLAQIISKAIGHMATLASGILLVGIGVHMILSSFNRDSKLLEIEKSRIGLIVLAFLVSIDSFSVGISLGLSGTRTLVTLSLFGLISTCLTWAGLLLGKKVHNLLGTYSEMLGGSILSGFGLYLLFA